jgi:hypothetical protein
VVATGAIWVYLIAQIEIQFFLDHWSEIRGSDGMRHVWQQIRVGRHPGFEEGALSYK